MTKLKSTLLVVILSLLNLNTYAQSSQEEVVKKVRQRYYRINGGEVVLEKTKLDIVDYYLEGNQLAIAKENTHEGRYEYYYDFYEDGNYRPYFIFFESKDKQKNPDLRAYYDDDGRMVLYKEGAEEKDTAYQDGNYAYLYLQGMNKINNLFNYMELIKHPFNKRVSYIVEKVQEIREKQLTKTEENILEEGGGESGSASYVDNQGRVLKKNKYLGSEHAGYQYWEYYDKGNKIFSIREEEEWVGKYSRVVITVLYYGEKGSVFRKDTYDSYGYPLVRVNNAYLGFGFDLRHVSPRIEYK